jgi:hypothetical protein
MAPSPADAAAPRLSCDRVIADFEDDTPGTFPGRWKPRDESDAERLRDHPLYRVVLDGNDHVLHAKTIGPTVTIGTEVEAWDLEEYPVLAWRWRVTRLPAGAAETDPDRNDTAASLYAIWPAGFPFQFRGIKYSWSSTLPVGTHAKKRLGHDHVLVVETGSDELDRWQDVRVDVREHFRSFFEEDRVEAPRAIALMTDADRSPSGAEAYYDDIRLCRFTED